MAAEMTKKQSLYTDDYRTSRTKQALDQIKTNRHYSSLRGCLTKAKESKAGLFCGYRVALLQQVTYSVALFSTFEAGTSLLRDENEAIFNPFDGVGLWYKFYQRFGVATFAIVVAAAVCHPIDTLKRRMQLNATHGYSAITSNGDKLPSAFQMAKYMLEKEGAASFYRGFSMCMVKSLPLALLQFSLLSSFRVQQPRSS